jgi:hypothetical protein
VKAMNRPAERIFNPDRKHHYWGKRTNEERNPLALTLRLRLDLAVRWLVELGHKVKK